SRLLGATPGSKPGSVAAIAPVGPNAASMLISIPSDATIRNTREGRFMIAIPLPHHTASDALAGRPRPAIHTGHSLKLCTTRSTLVSRCTVSVDLVRL